MRARDPLERLRSALGGVNVPIEAGSDYLSADLIDVPGDLYVAALQQHCLSCKPLPWHPFTTVPSNAPISSAL